MASLASRIAHRQRIPPSGPCLLICILSLWFTEVISVPLYHPVPHFATFTPSLFYTFLLSHHLSCTAPGTVAGITHDQRSRVCRDSAEDMQPHKRGCSPLLGILGGEGKLHKACDQGSQGSTKAKTS
ncbi:hypothetical protein F4820DRAFT_119991 [Hypoxylon rubiginosum]|uniref:Uncharacterized protein n=1 Tax=Hypoxylon rubiginosum TaxID=110542 RepID=A0ACB9YLU2_9PEZI|nr:hypothetical protein F4820DRAFT_119991 [Hypoxylon rubiginosum]